VTGQTIILSTPRQRQLAHGLIERAPLGVVVTIKEASRTPDQNARMWAMLSDISRAKPEGRVWPTEVWKAGFMSMLEHEYLWQPGLDGGMSFPAGFRSSRLNKAQMADLITCIQEYGDRHGVTWSDSSGNCTEKDQA